MNNERKSQISIPLVIGFLLLTPPLISIVLFIGQLIDPRRFLMIFALDNHATYFGLMAIAGAYLLKGRNIN